MVTIESPPASAARTPANIWKGKPKTAAGWSQAEAGLGASVTFEGNIVGNCCAEAVLFLRIHPDFIEHQ